ADHVVVDNLLGALEYFEPRRTLGPLSDAERARFGLTKPRFRVAFTIGRDRVSFRVGSPAADGGTYLELVGKSGYVVGKDFVEVLDHDASEYHAKELHEGVSVHSMEHLTLRDATGERSIEKHSGFYWMTTPFVGMVSEPKLRGVIDGFDGLRASRYVAEASKDLAPYGLATPRFELSLTSRVFDPKAKVKGQAHEEKLDLRIGAACSGHGAESYLEVNDGPIFCGLDADLVKMKKSASELRETRALPLEDGDIHGVRIVAGDGELVLTESGNDTLFRQLDHGHEVKKGMVDPAALHDWYAQLRGLNAAQFLPPSAAGAKPIVEATFKQGKDEPDYVLRLFGGSATETLATRLDDPALLQLPATARALVSTTPVRFRKRELSDEDETKFLSVRVRHPNGVEETVRKNVDGRFELSGPVVGTADRMRVDEVVHALSKLAALRFVSESALPDQGLSTPHSLIAIEYQQGDKIASHRLELGSSSAEGRFARLDGDPAVFLIATAV
ncbi:MAG TPA: DUF4340 domain-containing protein, partial [Polyangiales bacterium]|nr:DUF4340 domain-containing protein [Polyangiales bacterium]